MLFPKPWVLSPGLSSCPNDPMSLLPNTGPAVWLFSHHASPPTRSPTSQAQQCQAKGRIPLVFYLARPFLHSASCKQLHLHTCLLQDLVGNTLILHGNPQQHTASKATISMCPVTQTDTSTQVRARPHLPGKDEETTGQRS